MNNQSQHAGPDGKDLLPWYKQFWPWFIIALPASVVIASFYTLWLAISNPDHLVVDEGEYQQLRSELKAQPSEQNKNNDKTDTPDSIPDH